MASMNAKNDSSHPSHETEIFGGIHACKRYEAWHIEWPHGRKQIM
jgi:hypothetical protein